MNAFFFRIFLFLSCMACAPANEGADRRPCDDCRALKESVIRKVIHPAIYTENAQATSQMGQALIDKIRAADLRSGIKFWSCYCENNKVYHQLWGAKGKDYELEISVEKNGNFSITDLRPAVFSHP